MVTSLGNLGYFAKNGLDRQSHLNFTDINDGDHAAGGNRNLAQRIKLINFQDGGGVVRGFIQGDGAVVFKDRITEVSVASYTILESDGLIHVTRTTAGACELTLSSSWISAGGRIEIKDGGLNAGTNNVIIVTESTETIDGASSYVISSDGGFVSIYSDGTDCFVKG